MSGTLLATGVSLKKKVNLELKTLSSKISHKPKKFLHMDLHLFLFCINSSTLRCQLSILIPPQFFISGMILLNFKILLA